jgi:hypothetical protein
MIINLIMKILWKLGLIERVYKMQGHRNPPPPPPKQK